jgi:RNA polymerase-binding transcription factor DksA
MPASAESDPATLLRAEQERLAAQISALQQEFDRVVEASTSSNADDEHDPEGSTIAFERAQVAALLDQSRGRLADVHRALEHVAAGDYGRCVRCGRDIAVGRLLARPDATLCIECARHPRST